MIAEVLLHKDLHTLLGVFQIRMCFMRLSKVHVWSSVLYTGCMPHVHVLALITAQQLDMQAHKAGRKLFLEESAIALVCCTAEQPAWDVCSAWGEMHY